MGVPKNDLRPFGLCSCKSACLKNPCCNTGCFGCSGNFHIKQYTGFLARVRMHPRSASSLLSFTHLENLEDMHKRFTEVLGPLERQDKQNSNHICKNQENPRLPKLDPQDCKYQMLAGHVLACHSNGWTCKDTEVELSDSCLTWFEMISCPLHDQEIWFHFCVCVGTKKGGQISAQKKGTTRDQSQWLVPGWSLFSGPDSAPPFFKGLQTSVFKDFVPFIGFPLFGLELFPSAGTWN